MDNFDFKKYLAEGKIHKDLTENLGIELPKVTSQKANAKITNARTFAEFILDTWNTIATEENESIFGLQDLKLAKEKLEKVAKMKNEGEPVAENARTDAEEEGYKDGIKDEKADMKKMKVSELKAKIKEQILAELSLSEAEEEVDVNKILSNGGYDEIDDEELLATVKGRLKGKSNIGAKALNLLVMKIEDEEGGNIDFSEGKLSEEEEVDVDIDVEDEVEVDAEADDIEIERKGVKAKVEVGLSPEEEIIQDSLKAAMDAANSLGNDKLADQIGNTITFFTREYVVGDRS